MVRFNAQQRRVRKVKRSEGLLSYGSMEGISD